MASEVHAFTCKIPAGTPINALVTVPITLDNRVLESLDIEVPAGPAGNMGFYITHSGTPQFPLELGEFIVWDDREKSYKTEDYPTSQGWAVVGYNLDEANDHSVTLRFHTNYPAPGQPVVPVINIVSTPAPLSAVVL